MDRYESYNDAGVVTGVWRITYSEEAVRGFRDEWHPGDRLRRIMHVETVTELG